MTKISNSIKINIFNGIFLLIPLGIILFIMAKIFVFMLTVVKPIEKLLPIDTVFGIVVINLLAVFALFLLFYLAGVLAQTSLSKKILTLFNNRLAILIPGYAIAKQKLAAALDSEIEETSLKVVLVQFDDFKQIAYEVERLDDQQVVVYLPGAPDVFSGQVVIVDSDRITLLKAKVKEAGNILKDLGRGSHSILRV